MTAAAVGCGTTATIVGVAVGFAVGVAVGACVGVDVGICVGIVVGDCVAGAAVVAAVVGVVVADVVAFAGDDDPSGVGALVAAAAIDNAGSELPAPPPPLQPASRHPNTPIIAIER